MRINYRERENLFLVLSISISMLVVLYLTFYLNFTTTTNFFEVLKESFNFSKSKYQVSLYFTLLWKSTLLVLVCLILSFLFGFVLSKYEVLAPFLNTVAAVPEILIAVLLRALMWDPVRYSNNELAKGVIICLPIVLRNTASMYRYFRMARDKYTQTYFYYLTIMRDMSRAKKAKYLIQSTFLDAMSNLIYEFPLLISYVAVLERVFEFRGLSREFLNVMIYGNPYELFRYTILVLTTLALFQTIFLMIIRASDKR